MVTVLMTMRWQYHFGDDEEDEDQDQHGCEDDAEGTSYPNCEHFSITNEQQIIVTLTTFEMSIFIAWSKCIVSPFQSDSVPNLSVMQLEREREFIM